MLVIQDPTNEESTYLLESTLDALNGAQKVGGAFAFVSAAGVRLIAEDDAFQAVARAHPVDLVIGIDAVTNVRALDRLTQLMRDFPNVTVRAFMNPRPEALFHPKFSWFKHATGGRLITGSGNLTEGGLLGNWEAYSVEQLNAGEMTNVERAWDDWKRTHAAALLPLDNEEVQRRARNNNVMAREGDLPTLVAPTPPPPPEEEPQTTQLMPATAAVLIAEIPASGDRWKQANFQKDDYENFFGARAGRLVLFRHVNADGTMQDYEKSRPPVTVKSRNFRFELAAASGLSYPATGRPIGVFIRVATRTFFYRLLMPSDPQHANVLGILTTHEGIAGTRMRSTRMTVEQLRREWPDSPFWRLPSA